ncbi:Leukotriene A-4 hydrolase, partial [Eschrichtius robustus]|nr:Leukotriene A-4 hydrolase [Eschrichtius robustus]
MPEVVDACSLASPVSVCRTKHLHLRCSVDFTRRVLTGTAALTVQSQEDNLRSLILDTKDLTIEKVVINGQEVKYALGERQSYKGSPVEISLPIALCKNQEIVIEISFETSPKSSALQWLTPEQTSGKEHPYLFSQCQVSVPKELVALMSAIRDGEAPDTEDTSRKIYRFSQKVPIPCYLIALVVGALESRQIGPRTLVWSEKEQVEKSAYEFSETESMLKIAEDLGGPYIWGQYDLLVLPPSFPYGGMEHPCLTFVTPTLLAGDKSLSNGKEDDLNSFSSADLKDFSSHQVNEFLAQMLQKAPLPLGHIKRMQEVYNFNAINNSEIRFRWLRLCIQSKWEEAIPLALKMATEQGRMKFTRPLFNFTVANSSYHMERPSPFQTPKVIEGDAMSSDFIPSQPEGVYLYSKYREPEKYIALDGDSLTTEDLVSLGKGHYKIKLTPTAEKKVQNSREVIESIVKEKTVVYGITTGFGKFARTVIPVSKLEELQVNLVRSHSSGVGKPLIPERCRMLLALRVNVLAKGYSGISLETLKQVIEVFNASCLPYVPEKGTVGASGDLAPLSHLALGLIGEGKMWSPKSGWADAKYPNPSPPTLYITEARGGLQLECPVS